LEFVRAPLEFDKFTARERLKYCLGATLYMPGTRNILPKIIDRSLSELTSMVLCLEDAIEGSKLADAEQNVRTFLQSLQVLVEKGTLARNDVPLIFVRVRNTAQFEDFVSRLARPEAGALTGFVFPKLCSANAETYFSILRELNERLESSLYAMPILEGPTIAFRESRQEELDALRNLLRPHRDCILNIRVGGTDFSALFGVRRGINCSIYDILPVRDCISDVLNFFNRAEDDYTIAAPVWEYFLADKNHDLNDLMANDLHRSLFSRTPVLNEAVDGLLREVVLDKANGFIGKTIIHPSHLRFVNGMQAVTREEYDDAMQILGHTGGVVKSSRANKMNEISPHRPWAQRVAALADAFGVIEDETHYLKLFRGN
jgi:citrate lyase beta subunit